MRVRATLLFIGCIAACGAPAPVAPTTAGSMTRARPSDLDIHVGTLVSGPLDAITDVRGVRVGHCTRVEGEDVRTGVTVILPHAGNPFRDKVPAAIAVQNGFGKLVGSTQVAELGELESPIALTNTLSVGTVMDALVGWTLTQPGNEDVRSVNVVVGETNDARLNDIRGRHVRGDDVLRAIATATDGPFDGGSVGAGTGTSCLGFKGGIGTSSRSVDGFTVGVLVQSNFGGRLRVLGHELPPVAEPPADRGSCMIVIATDAPLDALMRIKQVGDDAIAFSTARNRPLLANDAMSGLFVAVADATEQAILDSLLRATTVRGCGRESRAVPIDAVRRAARGEG